MSAGTPDTDAGPVLGPVKRHTGVAGQVAYSTTVTYPGEVAMRVTFTGSLYGTPGPVVVDGPFGQMFVSEPERFGDTFSAAWVRAFYAPQAPPPPRRCPACDIPLTGSRWSRVHAGGMSCGHGPHG